MRLSDITKIPNDLPENLYEFDCQRTQVSKIKNLPKNLQRFYCESTRVNKIENLPENLQGFYCGITEVSKIENLPENLQGFYCNYTKVSKIENLPENLHEFYCGGTEISKIENLPENLHEFYCNDTKVSKIENLPIGLKYFLFYNITHIDLLNEEEYNNILGRFNIKKYNLIRRLQRYIRFKIKWKRENAARIIQLRYLNYWYYPPKCKDGTIGLACQRMLRHVN
jgi:Leucine-rich repeat (LRR) protein